MAMPAYVGARAVIACHSARAAGSDVTPSVSNICLPSPNKRTNAAQSLPTNFGGKMAAMLAASWFAI